MIGYGCGFKAEIEAGGEWTTVGSYSPEGAADAFVGMLIKEALPVKGIIAVRDLRPEYQDKVLYFRFNWLTMQIEDDGNRYRQDRLTGGIVDYEEWWPESIDLEEEK